MAHRLLCVEWRRRRVLPAGSQICLVPGRSVPTPGVIVRHQVPEIEERVHAPDVYVEVVLRARRTRHCELEVVWGG